MTAPDKILQEVAALRREINYHNRLYYTLDSPEIPDADYDALFDRLTELEHEYDLVTPEQHQSVIQTKTSLWQLKMYSQLLDVEQ